METKVKKPDNLKKFELIVIIGLEDASNSGENIVDMSYTKSLLAINQVDKKVQIYINSKTQKGLNDFKKAYPTAEVRTDATLEEPEKWSLLGFPRYASDEEETPLDVFYKAQHNEVETNIAREQIKEEGRKNK